MQVSEPGASIELDPAAESEGRTCLPARALAGLLRQLKSLLQRVDDAKYAAAPHERIDSIGRQVQRMLDPVSCLLEGLETGTIEYDRPEPRMPNEAKRAAALERIDALITAVSGIAAFEIDRPVHVAAHLTDDGTPHESLSSVGRELMFSVRELNRGRAQLDEAARASGPNPAP